jgi:hypothetical protein|tara:strand:+ start:608 stop:742 length:135 start_codon:yes stop_codon:yes gene_type:complete
MKKEKKNPVAKELRTRKYRPKVKSSKKVYVREKDKFKFVGFTDY